jgi:predicted MFS family arabinose efflux permease
MVAVARLVPQRPRERRETGARLDLLGAALLGAAVLCVLLPTVAVEGGDRLPLLLLVGAVPLAWLFVRRELRLVRTGGAPLLDIALLRRTPGYANGLAVGTLYFTGFTGIFLVLSVYLQEGMGFSPLEAGLLLTPFAVGSAFTAPLAGRLVSRIHRLITVIALGVMMTGVLAVALLVPGRGSEGLWLVLVPPLLLAGLGGGGVVSPNFPLRRAVVPPGLGGAAGGALQTGQRIGSSIGAALLMTVYGIAASTSPGRGLEAALLASLGVLAVAMVMAVRSLRQERG